MKRDKRVSKHYSAPLMKQNIRSNWVLTVVIILISCMMSTVICIAMDMMERMDNEDRQAAQMDFYTHLTGIAIYNQMPLTPQKFSAEHFMTTENKGAYDLLFRIMNQQMPGMDMSVEKFAAAIDILADENGSVEHHVKMFEYNFALMGQKGAFTDEDLSMQGLIVNMLTAMGLPPDRLSVMAEMDPTTLINKMYYTVMGLLPLLLYVVIVGNSLIVNQVDSGSMAYVLATPTKRSAVANTQALFLILSPLLICAVVCAERIILSFFLTGRGDVVLNLALYGGMYILIEAIGGICYMGSCLFNQSRRAMAFGGGVAVWCFIASLIGMYGSKDMVDMGAGVAELDIFNKLTLIGLYDIKAISSIVTDSVDYSFVWKLCALAAVAIAAYWIGKRTFEKKDLPL